MDHDLSCPIYKETRITRHREVLAVTLPSGPILAGTSVNKLVGDRRSYEILPVNA
jgi:hypothetical protein